MRNLCTHERLHRARWTDDGGNMVTGGWFCTVCEHRVEDTSAPSADDEESTERALFHLHLAQNAWNAAKPGETVPGPGRGVSDWPALILAVADGVHRGWVASVEILGEGKDHTMNYGLTKRGFRALAAFRSRLASYPVKDEGDAQ